MRTELMEETSIIAHSQQATSSEMRGKRGSTRSTSDNGLDELDSKSSVDSEEQWFLRMITGDLVEGVRAQVELHPDQTGVSDETAKSVLEVASLAESCGRLSSDCDQCSNKLAEEAENSVEDRLENVAPSDLDFQALADMKKNRQVSRAQWSSVHRLLLCANIHLRNSAVYHQFHSEAADAQVHLEALLLGYKEKEVSAEVKDVSDMQTMMDKLKKDTEVLKLWEDQLNQLEQRAKDVVPVHLRTRPVDEPIIARALCSYKGQNFAVTEGESLVLENNEIFTGWKVKNSAEEEGTLPAIACLIPPPDDSAIETSSRLQCQLTEVWEHVCHSWAKRILLALTKLFTALEADKGLLKTMSWKTKEELFQHLDHIESLTTKFFQNEEEYEAIMTLITKIRQLLKNSSDGEDAPGLKTKGTEMMTKSRRIMELFEILMKGLERRKSKDASGSDSSEWDTLEDAGEMQGVGVKYRRQSERAETSSYTVASQEVRHSISITGIVDTRDNSRISLVDAIKQGILNQSQGVYVNPNTKDTMPIPEAINRGFILVESVQEDVKEEETESIGLVTLVITRETRPYTITKVMDPRTDRILSVSDAITEGIYDQEASKWRNPDTSEEVDLETAIDMGGFVVDYDTEAEVTEPEVITRHFAIYGVKDPTTGKRIPFQEAVEKGFIDKETGVYTNTMKNETVEAVDAIRQGLVKARIVDDPDVVENAMRTRSYSTGSGDSK